MGGNFGGDFRRYVLATGFFLSLQGAFEYATYTTLAVAIVICAVGVILPPRWAEPVQYIIGVLALLSQVAQIVEKYL